MWRAFVTFVLVCVASVAGAACERPWARVPGAPRRDDVIASCTAEPTPLRACDWARGFDDLLVFAIDGHRALTEPVLDHSGNVVDDTSSCRVVGEGVEIWGYTETSAFGSRATSFLFSGDHEPLADDELVVGSRVLVAVRETSNFNPTEFVRDPFWPVVSEDGLVRLPNTECSLGSEFDGMPVEDVLRLVASCREAGEAIDDVSIAVGAVCFPPAD